MKLKMKIEIESKYDNINNPFPIYTKGCDENLYNHIFRYLNEGIKDGKRYWPNYINDIKEKKIRDNKKLEFCRKITFKKKLKKCINENIDNILNIIILIIMLVIIILIKYLIFYFL